MASKRSLYRPAPQENVGQKRNRKPLVQGRLVSGDQGPKKPHPSLASGIEESVTGNRVVKSPYRSFVKESCRTTDNMHTDSFQSVPDQESFALTPRRKAPELSEHRSPSVKSPATTLDLSDSDIDIRIQSKSPLTRIHKQRPQEVLLIDASRQTKDPNESEVDIRIGFEKSPVRIVCHSAAPEKSNLRDTSRSGNKNANNSSRPVQILRENSQPRESPPPARLIIDSGNHGDSPKNLADGMERILTQIERDAKKGQLKFHQPNFDDSDDDRPTRQKREPIRDRLENIDPELSDYSDVCSLNEYVTSARKKSNTVKKAPEKAPAKAPNTGKKKNSRVIPSRYKQSAESKAKTSLSVLMDKTASKNNNKSKASKSMDMPNKSRQKPVRKTVPPKTDCHTPDNSRLTSGGKTSTPTMDGSFFPTEIDASVIQADISVSSNVSHSRGNTGPKKPSAVSKSKVHDPFSYSILSNASVDVSHHSSVKRSEPSKVTQHHIDLLYTRYLTWLHMYSSAKKTKQEQEKQAMAQLYGLHKEVEKLRSKKHDLDVELTHLQHMNMLDEQVELQRQSLGPVTTHLDKLSKEYENLAHALDTTRHQIPTKGVYLPDDEDQFQRKLEQELMASEQLLGELSVMIRQPVTTVTSMSKALQAMEKAVEAESHEIERCTEMLAASKSLAIQETSLQIQSMQALET